MLGYYPAPDGAAMPVRVAAITIKDTTFETINPGDYVGVLFRFLELCVVPAEQRFRAHCGSGDISVALVTIDVWFPFRKPTNAPILGPLTADYSALVGQLRVLKIVSNAYDESAALSAFAALAPHLQELSFPCCGLTSVQGLEGRCEYLRKMSLFNCRRLTSIDALANRVYLEELDASETSITSIEPLRTCPNLTKVFLIFCQQLFSVDALANHQRLKEVDASETGITSVEPLRSCPALTTVILVDCQQLPANDRLPASFNVIREW